jgi:uncharacterized protein with GYD domain
MATARVPMRAAGAWEMAMQTFIMLTRLAHGALKAPMELETLEHQVRERIHNECPEVVWAGNWAVCGPYDYVDVFHARDVEAAMKVATIIRTFGHAQTELWPAVEWKRFKEMIHHLPVV